MKFQKIALLLFVCSAPMHAAGLLPTIATTVGSYFKITPQEPCYPHLTKEDQAYIEKAETSPKDEEFVFIIPRNVLQCVNILRQQEKQKPNSNIFTATGSINEITAELTRLSKTKSAEIKATMTDTQKTELTQKSAIYKSLATNLKQSVTSEKLFAALEAINQAGTIQELSLLDYEPNE